MHTITVAELRHNFDRHYDIALREPVTVVGNNGESWVLLAEAEYNRLMRREHQMMKTGRARE